MCSYHFSPPVIVKEMSLCPSNISPFPVCSGSYLSHLFRVHIFTPFFPIFSFSPFLQVPFQYLNMLRSLLFLNSSSPIAAKPNTASFHSHSPIPTTAFFYLLPMSNILKELSPISVSMSVPPIYL